MRPCLLLLILLPASILASTPEEQARTVIDRLDSAQKAKDVDAVGRLLADDCIVIMTEPNVGAKAARFLTKQGYLDALTKRSADVSATLGSSTIQAITSFPSGDVCVARDSEGRSRVGVAVDWIRSRDYLILRRVGDQLRIRLVVTEAVFYFPNVPPEPPK